MKKVSYIDSNFLSPRDAWDALSVAEKAEMMKIAIRNGITNLQDIRAKYNEFSGGGYMDKAKALIKKNEGWMAKPYKDAPKGKSWRSVGYGFNDSGFYDKYPEGISRHYENGITRAQAEQELSYILNKADKHLRSIYGKQWDSFNDNQKAAIMDTYYQRPASVGKKSAFYNAVKSGKDASKYLGVNGFADRNRKRQSVFSGGAVPAVAEVRETSLPQATYPQFMAFDDPEFVPMNPFVFETPSLPYQGQEIAFGEPVEQETLINPYSPEEIERQERAEGLSNLQKFLSFMGSSGTGNSFLDTMGMLASNTFAKGGDLKYSYTKPLNNVFVDDEGNLLDPEVPSAKGTIRTPEVIVATRDPRKAAPTTNSLNTSNIESTAKEAIKNYFVGNLSDDEVRRRLYHNLAPYGYTHTIARLESAIKNNTSHEFDRRHKNDRDRQDIWAEYLGIPKEERKILFDSSTSILKDSQYSPTVGKEQNIKYKAISNPSEADVRDLIQHAEVLPIGKNKVVAGGIGHALGRYTIGHNYDNKGEYVSYYDKWDLNPFSDAGEDLSLGIGKPVNIYDRIYLDDYYGLPEEYRGSTYIPELTVTANKHAEGGGIHIKPSHRGRLTELKNRTGKSEAELYKKGGPAVRKMITFARNARKWHK